MNKNISVIVPAFNEEAGIREVISGLKKVLNNMGITYEIIVVDDGSKDKTYSIVKDLKVKIIRHSENLGYGESIKDGILKSSYDWLVLIDADGSYSPEDLPVLLDYIDRYDMVVGARTGKVVKIPLFRLPVKWILNQLANYLSRKKIPDLNSGLRIFRKEVALKFFNLFPSKFSFTTTITLAFLTNNYLVKYVPINYYRRKGKSTFPPLRGTFDMINLIIRIILYFNPLRIFIPVSLFLGFLAFAILFGSWYLTGKPMDITFGVILIGAFQALLLGLLADLIDKRIQK